MYLFYGKLFFFKFLCLSRAFPYILYMKNFLTTNHFLVLIRYGLYFAMNIQHSIQTTQHMCHMYACMFLLLKMRTQGPYTNKHIVTPIRITSPCKNQNITGNRLSLVPNSDSSNFLFELLPFWVSPCSRVPTQDCSLPFYMLILFLVCEKKEQNVTLHWFLWPDSGQTL